MVFPDFIRRCVLFADDGAEEEPVERETGERGRNPVEYRIVQKQEGSIIVYADFGTEKKAQVLAEFEQLAWDRDFILPEIRFAPYYRETGKKLKRVERQGKSGRAVPSVQRRNEGEEEP